MSVAAACVWFGVDVTLTPLQIPSNCAYSYISRHALINPCGMSVQPTLQQLGVKSVKKPLSRNRKEEFARKRQLRTFDVLTRKVWWSVFGSRDFMFLNGGLKRRGGSLEGATRAHPAFNPAGPRTASWNSPRWGRSPSTSPGTSSTRTTPAEQTRKHLLSLLDQLYHHHQDRNETSGAAF